MSDSHEQQLLAIRQQIDAIDEQLHALINQRASCAQRVAEIKLAMNERDPVFYRPEREAQLLREIARRNQGPLPDKEMVRLFREIISACLALENPMRVAYLGPEGTFTQVAALKHFGHSIVAVSMSAIDEVFREVESGSVSYGVVPVENSTEGVVNHTLDMFMRSPLFICGEVELRVHHHLMSCEASTEAITRVYTHQQSLAQCREWLDANLPNAERWPLSSNAEAARLCQDQPGTAAIASELAAHTYKLNVLAKNIEDEPNNTTRFLVIGHQQVKPSGRDKTSLLISATNRPGSLYRLLEPLARHRISMTRIESRPSRGGLWEYVFFVDIEGHREDEQIRSALEELRGEAALFRVLGSYPSAVI